MGLVSSLLYRELWLIIKGGNTPQSLLRHLESCGWASPGLEQKLPLPARPHLRMVKLFGVTLALEMIDHARNYWLPYGYSQMVVFWVKTVMGQRVKAKKWIEWGKLHTGTSCCAGMAHLQHDLKCVCWQWGGVRRGSGSWSQRFWIGALGLQSNAILT